MTLTFGVDLGVIEAHALTKFCCADCYISRDMLSCDFDMLSCDFLSSLNSGIKDVPTSIPKVSL